MKKYNKRFRGARWIILASFCFIAISSFAQEKGKIYVRNSNVTKFSVNNSYQRLLGDVKLQHDSMYMYCDSARFSQKLNKFLGYSKVKFVQGDTLFLYGNKVEFDGNTRRAKVREKVQLIDSRITLTTDSLDFDSQNNIGIYDYGATIVDSANVLTSRVGRYYVSENLFLFSDSVKLVNADFTMYADTLKYNTQTGRVYIVGDTRIVSDDGELRSQQGWYDTHDKLCELKHSAEVRNENQVLRGDLVRYDREKQRGVVLGNVYLEDLKNSSIITGQKAVYEKLLEKAFVTDSALYKQVAQGDTLYMHADTLKAVADTVPDERVIRAYNNVRLYKSDFQGKCDSLIMFTRDSVMHMYNEPILWAQANELKAEFIEVIPNGKNAYMAHLLRNAFVIAQEDSIAFNQMKGKEIVGYIHNRNLFKVKVDGNAESLYYVRDGEGLEAPLIGMNKVACSSIVMHLRKQQLVRISFLDAPDSRLIPIKQLTEQDSRLRFFKWNPELRPKDKLDVFRTDGKFVAPKIEKRKLERKLEIQKMDLVR